MPTLFNKSVICPVLIGRQEKVDPHPHFCRAMPVEQLLELHWRPGGCLAVGERDAFIREAHPVGANTQGKPEILVVDVLLSLLLRLFHHGEQTFENATVGEMYQAGRDMSGHAVRADQAEVLQGRAGRARHHQSEGRVAVINPSYAFPYSALNSFDHLPDDPTARCHILEGAFQCVLTFTWRCDRLNGVA